MYWRQFVLAQGIQLVLFFLWFAIFYNHLILWCNVNPKCLCRPSRTGYFPDRRIIQCYEFTLGFANNCAILGRHVTLYVSYVSRVIYAWNVLWFKLTGAVRKEVSGVAFSSEPWGGVVVTCHLSLMHEHEWTSWVFGGQIEQLEVRLGAASAALPPAPLSMCTSQREAHECSGHTGQRARNPAVSGQNITK